MNVCNAKYARTPICTFVECNARVYTAFFASRSKKNCICLASDLESIAVKDAYAHALNRATATTKINKI